MGCKREYFLMVGIGSGFIWEGDTCGVVTRGICRYVLTVGTGGGGGVGSVGEGDGSAGVEANYGWEEVKAVG